MTLKKMVDAYRTTYVHNLEHGVDHDIITEEAHKLWNALYVCHTAGLCDWDTWTRFYDKCKDWEVEYFLNGGK